MRTVLCDAGLLSHKLPKPSRKASDRAPRAVLANFTHFRWCRCAAVSYSLCYYVFILFTNFPISLSHSISQTTELISPRPLTRGRESHMRFLCTEETAESELRTVLTPTATAAAQ